LDVTSHIKEQIGLDMKLREIRNLFEDQQIEGLAGAVAGGLAGVALTKSPIGATVGAKIGSALQDKVSEANTVTLNGKEINVSSIEIDGVDPKDRPDFADAYISYATFSDGTELSDEELDKLTNEHGDLVNELAHENMQGQSDDAYDRWKDSQYEEKTNEQEEPISMTKEPGKPKSVVKVGDRQVEFDDDAEAKRFMDLAKLGGIQVEQVTVTKEPAQPQSVVKTDDGQQVKFASDNDAQQFAQKVKQGQASVSQEGVAEGYDTVESDYQQWEDILHRGNPSGAYAFNLMRGDETTIRNILAYVKQNRAVLGKEVSPETGRTVKDAIIDIKNKFPQQYQAAQQPQGVAEGEEPSPVASAITRRIIAQKSDWLMTYGPEAVGDAIDDVASFVGDVDEIGTSDVSGWVNQVGQMLQRSAPKESTDDLTELEEGWKEKLAAAGLVGAMAMGAASPAQARVSIGPDGQMTPSFAQQVAQNPEVKKDASHGDSVRQNFMQNKDLQAADSVKRDGQSVVVTFDGKDYQATQVPVNAPTPRGAKKIKVHQAQMGLRGIGNYTTYLLPNGTAYIYSLPATQGESISESIGNLFEEQSYVLHVDNAYDFDLDEERGIDRVLMDVFKDLGEKITIDPHEADASKAVITTDMNINDVIDTLDKNGIDAHLISGTQPEESISESVLDDSDDSGFMAKSNIYNMIKDAVKLHEMIQDRDELEGWVEEKITLATDYIRTVREYLEYNNVRGMEQPEQPEVTTLSVPAKTSVDYVKDDRNPLVDSKELNDILRLSSLK
jgi:hypothetical protein